MKKLNLLVLFVFAVICVMITAMMYHRQQSLLKRAFAPISQNEKPSAGKFATTAASSVNHAQSATMEDDLPEPEQRAGYIAQLERESLKRGLHFSIFCTGELSDSSDEKFLAMATSNKSSQFFVEEGAKPYWAEYGATQQDAAKHLLISMRDAPNMHPPHRPKERAHCNTPPIEGGVSNASSD